VRSWLLVHTLPLLILPVLTLALGSSLGVDAAAVSTHAITLLLVPFLEARILQGLGHHVLASTVRAVVALAVSIVVAMVLMSAIDLAGYDTIATPTAMIAAGAVHALMLFWPIRVREPLGRWIVGGAAGWVLGTGFYRLLLLFGLRWQVNGQSLYGYAYTGGHNELLWVGAGLVGLGLTTGAMLARRTAPLAA